MRQSNALRRLEEILAEAVSSGERNQASGYVLLTAMNLSHQPQNIVDFYEVLNKAEEEARSIRNKPKLKLDRYLQTIEGLHQVFVLNLLWSEKWNTFASYIEDRCVLNTLDALADFFDSQNPRIFLEQDFLEKLNKEFGSLLNEVLEADLSTNLKRFLVGQIEDILQAIRRYHLDGTEGLEKSTKSLVSDLVLVEHRLEEKDKDSTAFKQVKAWALSLLIYIAPAPYDIIGAVPDIHDFWIPKFEELASTQKKVEQIIGGVTIVEAYEKTLKALDRQSQRKSIAGSTELKALPASEENKGTSLDEKK